MLEFHVYWCSFWEQLGFSWVGAPWEAPPAWGRDPWWVQGWILGFWAGAHFEVSLQPCTRSSLEVKSSTLVFISPLWHICYSLKLFWGL